MKMAKKRQFTVRCADFASEEGTAGDRPVTIVRDEEGEEYLVLPGHSLTDALVERVVEAVIRGEDRGEKWGRARAFIELRQLIGCPSAEDFEALRDDNGL